MRSLACNLPYESSKEFLIDYFESLRMKYLDLINKKEKNKSREDKKLVKFLLSHFRIQGILFTKIGIDELDELVAS